ncbi:MAG: sigma-E processing peptidase SpoIIGA [Oscillospiraceae bacterium]|jgi:stage II sporulation protein GA (sporulation sigma-E factor processing peptidase)|nr:sigma-E processing peptidase SpoIIGA [Oscillospiraceae bacterium]
MKTVYADEMFLLNLIINYFILLATAKLCALPFSRARFAASAAAGSVYSVCLLFPPMQLLATPVMKLVLGFVMTLTAFGAEKRLFRLYLAFLAVSAAFGGAVYAASLFAGQQLAGRLYINVSLRVLLLSFAVCYMALTLIFKRLAGRQARALVPVSLSFCGKTAEFSALLDTGNELYDPVSNLPVMVLDIGEAEKLLPETLIAPLRTDVMAFISATGTSEAYRTRFRLVPYSAVGVGISLLPVFRPDALRLQGCEEKNMLVGICANKISGSGEYSAIL